MEAEDYRSQYGEYTTNMRGDKEVKGPFGQPLILLNTPKIWTKETRIIQQARKKVDIGNPDDEISNHFSGQVFGDVARAVAGLEIEAPPAPSSSTAQPDDGNDDAVEERHSGMGPAATTFFSSFASGSGSSVGAQGVDPAERAGGGNDREPARSAPRSQAAPRATSAPPSGRVASAPQAPAAKPKAKASGGPGDKY